MESIEKCPICNGHQFTDFMTCCDYTVSHETFNLIRCETCELVITSPRPISELLSSYYISENYISHAKKAKRIFDKVYQISRLFTMRWKLKLINDNSIADTELIKLLDFGCGTGEFLYACKKSGYHIKGVEPSEIARSNSSVTIQENIHKSLEDISEDFDAITIWHVLEHVPDLNTLLDQLKQKLKKNGTMFIAVPNHQSKDSSIYQNAWAGYDVPRHLWHFTQSSMKHLLSSHNLTLQKTIPMKLDAFYVSMLSEKHKRNSIGVVSLAKGFLNGLKSNLEASQTNQYSSLIYVIRK